MERAGLRVDTKVLSELSKYLGTELEKLTEKIYKVAGREFKINSPKQVGDVLEELNISSGRKTSTGRVSTSKAVLEELAQSFELPRLIIEYRELDKLKTVYTDSLPSQIAEDGRIHGQLNQTVTATGRLLRVRRTCKTFHLTELGVHARAFISEKGPKLSPRILILTSPARACRTSRHARCVQKATTSTSARSLVFNARPKKIERGRPSLRSSLAIASAIEPSPLARVASRARKPKGY